MEQVIQRNGRQREKQGIAETEARRVTWRMDEEVECQKDKEASNFRKKAT